ncbi:MAG: hypothetical protein KDD36_12495 [Flavobacteriales bacterium]|nr:hypothetical protein [Flavobacteriales bacterium]
MWYYMLIREADYDVNTTVGDYIFAFFPLFPLVWKLSLLPITWVPLLNYVLFVTSLFLLFQSHSWNRMSSAHNRILFLIALTLPTIASFLMPYTEAVFAVTLAVALIGMMKGKYRMYFTGALLAAATRPSGTLIIGALFVLDLIRNHKLPLTILLREYLKKALPFALGTLLVGIYQHMVGSGSIFTFMDVQKGWGTKLAVPHDIRDWSHESFGMTMAVIFFIMPAVLFVMYQLLLKLKNKGNDLPVRELFTAPHEERKQYVFQFSAVYLGVMCLFAILFNGGNMHSIYRYICCTPFFYVFLLHGEKQLEQIPTKLTPPVFSILLLLGILFLSLVPYSTYWTFSDLGFFLLAGSVLLMITARRFAQRKLYLGLLATHIFFSALWTTWIFNMLLSDAWISV